MKSNPWSKKSGRICSALLLLLTLSAPNAMAATIAVTTNADSGAGSLRDALTSATTGDIIDMSAIGNQTIILASDLPSNTNNLTIIGAAANPVTIQSAYTSGIVRYGLKMAAGQTLTFNDTISNGKINLDKLAIYTDLGTTPTGNGKLAFTGTSAPVFGATGKNTLLLTNWNTGTFDVITSETALAAGSDTKFTVGGYRKMLGNDQNSGNITLGTRLQTSLALVSNGAGGSKLQLTTNNTGANATVSWTGAIDNNWGNNALNWRSNGVDIFVPGDEVRFVNNGDGTYNVNNRDINIVGNSVTAKNVKVNSDNTTNYSFSGGALNLTGTASTDGFSKTGTSTLTWNAPTGTVTTHQMNGFYNSAAGVLNLVGNHSFNINTTTAPSSANVTFTANGATYNNQGNITFNNAYAKMGNNNNIGTGTSLKLTGSSGLEFNGGTTTTPILNLGTTGTIAFDNVAGSSRVGKNDIANSTQQTTTATGVDAVLLDGTTQTMTLYDGSRFSHTNKGVTFDEIGLIAKNGSVFHVRSSDGTFRFDTATNKETLHLDAGSTLYLGTSSTDAMNSSVKVTGGGAFTVNGGLTLLGNTYPNNRTMTLDPGVTVTNTANAQTRFDGISLNLSGSTLDLKQNSLLSIYNHKPTSTDTTLGNFTFNNSVLKLTPNTNNGPSIYTQNTPIFTGSNTLNFMSMPTGTYTILRTGGTTLASANPGGFFQTLQLNGTTLTPGTTFGRFTVGNVLVGGTALNAGKDLLISVTSANDVRTWSGADATNPNRWDVNTSENWVENDKKFVHGDKVIFDGTGAPATLSNIAITGGTMTASDMVVSGANAQTISGSAVLNGTGYSIGGVAATGTLDKSGTGTLTLRNGTVGMQALKLQAGEITLDGATLKHVDTTTPLNIDSSNMATGSILSSTGASTLDNVSLDLASGRTLDIKTGTLSVNNSPLTVNSGSTVKTGATGTIDVVGGTLSSSAVTSGNNAMSLNAAGNVTVDNNTRWNASGAATYTNTGITVNNGGYLSVTGATGQHILTGTSGLDLKSGSSLYMDLDNRPKTLAAIDASAAASVAMTGVNILASWTPTAAADSGSWLVLKSNAAVTGDPFGTTATEVAAGTLLPKNTATLTFDVDYSTANEVYLKADYDPLPSGGGGTGGGGTGGGGTGGGGNPTPDTERQKFLNDMKRIRANTESPDGRRAFPAIYGYGNRHTETTYATLESMGRHAKDLTPEGAVSTAISGMNLHTSTATTALTMGFARNPMNMEQKALMPQSFQSSLQVSGNSSWMQSRMVDLDSSINDQPAYQGGSLEAAAYANKNPFGIKIWGGYLGSFSSQDSKNGYSGYDANQNGFIVGTTFDIVPEWAVGAYVGYTTGDSEFNDINTDIDTNATHAGLFGRYANQGALKGLTITGDALYSYTDNDSTRKVRLDTGRQEMDASFDQNILGGGLEVAYDWTPSFDDASTITPFAAMRYSHLSQSGYTESGKLALEVDSFEVNAFTSTAGVRAQRDFNLGEKVVVTPKATAAWLHNYADDNASTHSNFVGSPVTFMTRSATQDRDAALLGAGVDVMFKQSAGWEIGLKGTYGAEIRQNSTDQTVFAGFEVRF